MKKIFKKYFIPHGDNNHQPHFLREKSVLFVSAFVFLVFVFSFWNYTFLTGTNLASIITSVLVDLANNDRVEYGENSLVINPKLVEAAQMKADDMAKKGYFAHQSPEGVTPWHWFGEAGYDFIYAGENLAVNFTDSYATEKAWMNSPGHRANILSSNFTEIGIATARGDYNGRETTFVVQLFGKPAPVFAIENSIKDEPKDVTIPVVEQVEQVEAPEKIIEEKTFIPLEGHRLTVETKKDLETKEPTEDAEVFLAVKNSVYEMDDDIVFVDSRNTEILPAQKYTSFWERVLASPQKIMSCVYLFLIILVSFSLGALVFMEMKKQSLKHIFYAFFLILLMGGLFYANSVFILPDIMIG